MKTDRELFLYELEGRGYTFENMTWLGNCFEDNILNMAWEMWQASVSREGYKLAPVEPTGEMYVSGVKERSSEGNTVDVYKAMINSI